MAEHDEINFEHEIDEQLKKLDEQIKIPEIPDAQGIFELAKKTKTKVIPFVNYKKFAGIAAAVVLILASVPVISGALGIGIGMDKATMETAEEPCAEPADYMNNQAAFDQAAESIEEAAEMPVQNGMMPEEENDSVNDGDANMEESKSRSDAGEDIKYALNEFFTANSASGSQVAGVTGDNVSSITEKFNKKRSMDIEIEEDSVSVMLYDDASDGEVITAFWVEGVYQTSYQEDEKYYLNTVKTVTEEEVEGDYYLPMLGDAVKGTYYLEENKIVISEKIVKGAISIWVEIDIGTGEYQITASVI